jgi:hypothetical protein
MPRATPTGFIRFGENETLPRAARRERIAGGAPGTTAIRPGHAGNPSRCAASERVEPLHQGAGHVRRLGVEVVRAPLPHKQRELVYAPVNCDAGGHSGFSRYRLRIS